MNCAVLAVFSVLSLGLFAGGSAQAGGIGDGTLPFSGHGLLAPGNVAHLELRASGVESAAPSCAGEAVSVSGRLDLAGASYPIERLCVLPSQEVRLDALTAADPIELMGRFQAGGFVGTLRWGGREPAPVHFSAAP